MNKKLLFATLSLAALASCSTDDFESQQQLAEGQTCPVKFEVLNNNAQTRAYMDGNIIRWEASKGDLFTLYHGAADAGDVTGYENATYKAETDGGAASLSTPTMIKEGYAVMFWPVDTTFRIKSTGALSIKIPAEQNPNPNKEDGSVEDFIPYVSDQVKIEAYQKWDESTDDKKIATTYNVAGKDRIYPVFMRPMASQLNLKADYAGTDATLKELEGGEDGITPIKVTSIDLLTEAGGTTLFTTEVPVKFEEPSEAISGRWTASKTSKTSNHNNWKRVTALNVDAITEAGQTNKLTTTCLNGNDGCKFVILPQKEMTTNEQGVAKAAVVVNTIYGKVVIAKEGVAATKYVEGEWEDAWYRFLSEKPAEDADGETTGATKETKGPGAGKYKTTSAPEFGMKQTLNWFYNKKASDGVVEGEPVGANVTRYVKVLLTHLDMSELHVKDDKQLRDAARVWKKMGLDDVTVYLDGDANNEFKISQTTIKVINDINASIAGGAKSFKVKPCTDVTHTNCTDIVITGGGNLQDIAFIVNNGGTKADVVLNAGETWYWKGTVKVDETGVNAIYNKGTMVNAGTDILKTAKANGSANDVRLINDNIWNVTGGTLNVQFDVTNNGTLTISEGAEYRQDGTGHVFSNMAKTLPERFLAEGVDEQVGKVNNNGVFATVDGGQINNYGLIEHLTKNAKTYITTNERTGSNFATAFGVANKMGRINLPYSNKDEDNISISATAPITQGFVSVTVDGDAEGKVLNNDAVGTYVNYIIIKSGIETITNLDPKIKYVEIADKDKKEIAWALDPAVSTTATYDGLMVLSNVNIKLGTTIIVTKGAFLDDNATMYVGGTFKINDADPTAAGFKTYYGDKSANFATNYVTF